MSVVHLSSGRLMEGEPHQGEIPHRLERDAILVYAGKFQSMDGPVEITDEIIDRLAENHNGFMARLRAAFSGSVLLKNSPPIQLDHSTSAKDTVGRLGSNVEIVEHTNDAGEKVKALKGRLTILGKENVEKVLDGRWSDLSIGADLDAAKLSELSVTPFPAAPGAAMLTRGDNNKSSNTEDSEMKRMKALAEALKAKLANLKKLAEAQPEIKKELEAMECDVKAAEAPAPEDEADVKESKEQMKQRHLEEKEALKAKHLEEVKAGKLEELKAKHMEAVQALEAKQSEELKKLEGEPKDESKLGLISTEEHKGEKFEIHKDRSSGQWWSEVGGAQSPLYSSRDAAIRWAHKTIEKGSLAADPDQEAKMTAAKELTAKLTAAKSTIGLSAKKAKIHARLAAIKAHAKITPAEIKKVDITKLAAESQATIDAVLSSYEAREPQVLVGMLGNARAEDIAKMAREMRIKKLTAEARENMPLKKHEMEARKARLAEGGPAMPGEEEEREVNIHIDALPGGEHMKHLEEVYGLMDSGKLPEAKDKMKALVESLVKQSQMAGTESAAAGAQEMEGLAEEVQKMQAHMDDLLKLAGTITG